MVAGLQRDLVLRQGATDGLTKVDDRGGAARDCGVPVGQPVHHEVPRPRVAGGGDRGGVARLRVRHRASRMLGYAGIRPSACVP